MATFESDDSSGALFDEAALLLGDERDERSPSQSTLPVAGKTPTISETDLASVVDGGRGDLCINSKASQGLHVTPPNGILVDKNLVPTLAALYIGDLEEAFLERLELKLNLRFRNT